MNLKSKFINFNTNLFDMVIENSLREIMTKQPVTIKSSESIEKAEEKMKKHHIRHLPIIKNKKLIGILSLTDLQRISFASSFNESNSNEDSLVYEMFTIEQIMTHHPYCIDINEGMKKAMQVLSEKEFHALPIMEDEKLVGIITTTDIIKYILDQCDF